MPFPRIGPYKPSMPLRNPTRNPSLMHTLRVEVHAAWLAARDPRAPWYARVFGILVTAYALSPIDLIPDFIPILGLVDDVLIIPVGMWIFVRLLPEGLFDECRAAAEVTADRPRSIAGILIVLLFWLGAAALIYVLAAWDYS